MPTEPETKDEALHFEVDRDQLEQLTKPGLAGHQWIQRGPYLICQSCPIVHALYIGTDHQLTGFEEDGTPILRKVE
jgi:hypothetical protein